MAASISRNDYVLDLVANLKQCLEKNMILMIMSDQYIVDGIGQIVVCIPRNLALIRIAEHRIEQHADPLSFNENTGVSKVTPPNSRPRIRYVHRGGLGGKE